MNIKTDLENLYNDILSYNKDTLEWNYTLEKLDKIIKSIKTVQFTYKETWE